VTEATTLSSSPPPIPPPRDDVPPAPEPVADRGQRFAHLRALDGLRGLAVVLVLLSHFAPSKAPGGFLGVDLFFVLSGFLITSLLVSEYEATHAISLTHFWLRRARRLYPALLVVVVVVLIHSMLFESPATTHRVALDGLASLFYVANWRFIASGQSYILQFLQQAPGPLRHTWSLAIEEQFYLVWPLVVLAITALLRRRSAPLTGAHARLDRRPLRHAVVGVSLALALASFTWMVAMYHRGASLDRIYYGTDTRVFMILVGAALGAFTAGRPGLSDVWHRWRTALIVVGCLGIAALFVLTAKVTTSSTGLYAGGYGLVALTMVAVLAAAAQPGPNPLARALEVRPLVGLGLISYGIYLWHWPISLWVTTGNTGLDGLALFFVRGGLTLGVSLASYYVVEQPIRRGWLPQVKGHGRRLVAPLVVASVVVCLLIPIVSFPAVDAAPHGKLDRAAARVVTTAYSRAPRCDGPSSTAPLPKGSNLLVQLQGNSLASEVQKCLASMLSARGARLERVTDPKGFLICRDIPAIEQQVLDPATHPDAAVLFLFVAYDQRCGSPWHRSIDTLVAFYKAHGTHVYLVPSVPIVKGGRDDLARGPLLEAAYYRQLAAQDPAHVTLLDAGTFLRDSHGTYSWRMPCLPGGEPGCTSDGTIGVRFVDGLHFCTDPGFAAHGCPGVENQGGERRASAGIAAGLLPSLAALAAAR
jgi:peptidoglycan/LPS O-acetylase OafA/YrhL